MDELVTEGMMQELLHAETKIERAMKNAFYEVGAELRHINRQKLYVLRYPTFEEYLDRRWDMSQTRAYQLIDAADVVDQLSTIVETNSTNGNFVELPTRESHVRALLKLEKPEQRAEVWCRVIEHADGNGITAKDVEAEVDRKLAELSKEWFTLEEWNQLGPEEQRRLLNQTYQNTKVMNQVNENIEWALWSWNPVTGCLNNCDYCYARDLAVRFFPQQFVPTIIPTRLHEPANTKMAKPRWDGDTGHKNVFTCSVADLFGKWVPDEWIRAVLIQAQNNPQWNFLFLTKFPQRLAEFEFPSNAWVGATVDKQHAVERAEKAFRNVCATVKWLSCEPMLEHLTFSSLDMFDWVVIGGASKSSQTPEFKPPREWINDLEAQARAAGCMIYEKTNLLERIREYPTG